MKSFLLLQLSLILSLVGAQAQRLSLSTQSDSSLYYYYQGWRNVLDEGDYTASERSFRKMVKFDPDFVVGMILLGRISSNREEREQIETLVEMRKSNIHGDERLLLDVFQGLLVLTNLRDKDPAAAKVQREKAFAVGEANLRVIAHRYPADVHTLSEYIEVLHYRHGAKVALDSINKLCTKSQLSNPFILGFTAQLEGEQGMYEKALQKAAALRVHFSGQPVPKPHVVFADIYVKMGKKAEAQDAVEKALALDPGNLDAQRLKVKIEKML